MSSLSLCFAAFVSAAVAVGEPLNIAVVDTGVNARAARSLAAALDTQPVMAGDIANADRHTLLVLRDVHAFPSPAFAWVRDFVARGGHLLAVGETPFEQCLYPKDGEWVNESQLLSAVTPEFSLIDWSVFDPSKCPRGTSQPNTFTRYTPLKDGFRGELRLNDPLGWETLEIACMGAPPDGHDVLRFRAAGQDQASSLLIEAKEKDGSRWMAVAPIAAREREIGIHAGMFQFWRDSLSQGRGGQGDRLNLSNLQSIAIGFALSHQPLKAGHYDYVVRGLSTGTLGAAFAQPEPLNLEGLCPSYKLFEARPARYTTEGPARGLRFDFPRTVRSPVARGMRVTAGREYVWQPLIKGYNHAGVWCATPGATLWHSSGATWTYLGFQPQTAVLAAFCRRLAQSLPQRPTFDEGPGPLLEVGAPGPCVKTEGGHFTLDGERWFAHGINFWPLYVTGLEPSEYFHNWLAPRFYIAELVEADLATLESLGVNLVSVQYTQVEEAPQLRDFLTRCGRHGIKVNIFLRDGHPTSPSATDDLSQRAFLKLLRAANLAGNPNVFAYDLAWEPILGPRPHRVPLDPLFETWAVEHYGSVEHAESVWGAPANREQNQFAGPTDEQLTQDGPHRVMVAAYRRFLDDLISRRYREIIRLAREIDDTHLFGVRTGYGGTGTLGVAPVMPYQVTSGAAHLDFISPEGYGYGPANITDAALVTQYARWAGNNKPVFWAEFGMSVWEGGEPGLKRQKTMYEAFADMVRRTGAAGWAPWWYPGGYRVDERSDYGIVAPDRTPRPSAEVMRRHARTLKEGAPLPPGDALVFTRDGHPSGIAAVVQELSEPFRRQYWQGRLPSLQTAGTGTTSANCPLTGVGGVPYAPPGPPEYLNAEVWVESRVGGALKITLLNTGEATWLASGCQLRVDKSASTERIALPKDVPQFDRVIISFPNPGTATLVMESPRFGAFGERLKLRART